MENFNRNPSEGYNDESENIAEVDKNHEERVRQSIEEFKIEENNPHFKFINLKELNYDDLTVFDKFQRGELSEDELKNYRQKMDSYFESQAKNKGKDFNEYKDSRSNFLAMISNKLLNQTFEKRILENKNRQKSA